MALAVAGGRLLARRNLARLRASGPWERLGLALDGRPSVVSFSTPGCVGCAEQKQILESLGPGVRVVALDATERPDLAQAFGVLTAPTTVVFDSGGQVLAANNGFAPRGRLARQLSGGASKSEDPVQPLPAPPARG